MILGVVSIVLRLSASNSKLGGTEEKPAHQTIPPMVLPRESRVFDSEKAKRVRDDEIPKFIDEVRQTGHTKNNSPLGLEREIVIDEAIFEDQLAKKKAEIQFATTLPVSMGFDSSLDLEEARKIQENIRGDISKSKIKKSIFPK